MLVGVLVAGCFALREVAPERVRGVDVEVAFAAVAAGAPVEVLRPFADEVPPAAIALAQARLAVGVGVDDISAASALVEQALARDPGNPAAWQLKAALAPSQAAFDDVVTGAARWGVVLTARQ